MTSAQRSPYVEKALDLMRLASGADVACAYLYDGYNAPELRAIGFSGLFLEVPELHQHPELPEQLASIAKLEASATRQK